MHITDLLFAIGRDGVDLADIALRRFEVRANKNVTAGAVAWVALEIAVAGLASPQQRERIRGQVLLFQARPRSIPPGPGAGSWFLGG